MLFENEIIRMTSLIVFLNLLNPEYKPLQGKLPVLSDI